MEPKPELISASITDRGLSEKRPQNEDSLVELPQFGVFAVADGVGTAYTIRNGKNTKLREFDQRIFVLRPFFTQAAIGNRCRDQFRFRFHPLTPTKDGDA